MTRSRSDLSVQDSLALLLLGVFVFVGGCFGFEFCQSCADCGEVVPVAVAVAGLALAFLLLDLGVNLGDFLLEVGTATLEVLDDFVLFHCCTCFYVLGAKLRGTGVIRLMGYFASNAATRASRRER